MNMEVMLNKLRSTVSSAASNAVSIASQVSNYLPGNPVTREFEATEHIASAGRGLMWKVYKGYKKSTKQEAAIFLFEKRQLDKWGKQEREAMLDKMRKGVCQLTRLRHPQVLIVQHPLEESRETLAFATEPVLASLANLLGNTTNMPTPIPSTLKDFKFYDIEIKYGLMQLSEGLSFLHNSVKIVHRCLSPETVIVNHEGAWKIFGFDFCVVNESPPDQQPSWTFEEYESSNQEFSQPNLDYMSPEYALAHTLSPATDMFSLGAISFALYNEGKPIFENYQDFSLFKRNCSTLKTPAKVNLGSVPEGLKGQIQLLIHATPELRPDALQFSSISYFDDVGVKTLSYLDQLFQWDNIQKSQFYKSLPQIVPHLPHRVSLLRVIPCLNKECVNPTMIPFVLPTILLVAEKAMKEEFIKYILPHLKPIMKITEPIQIMLLLMQKMELLLSKTPAEDVRNDVLPLFYRALECDTQQIQELCLSVVPTCVPLVDQATLKNALLPRIKRLCLSTGYLTVRVNCLVSIGKVLDHLDKWVVTDEVFPFLSEIPSREAPVVMAIVGIYKVALHHKKLGISKEVLATKVLPFLFPLSVENSLSPSQYRNIMVLVRDMIERVETDHTAKLEHLESIRSEQKSLALSMPVAVESSGSTSLQNGSVGDVNELFKNLDMKKQGKESRQPSTPKPSTTVKPPADFSLDEKKRLADHHTMHSTLKDQPPLLPSPPSSQPSRPTLNSTKENTSSFIDQNLHRLSNLKSPTQNAPSMSQMQQNSMTTPTNMSFNPLNQTVGNNQMFNTMGSVNWGTVPSSQNPPKFQMQSSPLMYNALSQPNSIRPLASPMSQFNNNSFGSFQSATQSHTVLNSTNQNSNYKPLSSSDINDLLS